MDNQTNFNDQELNLSDIKQRVNSAVDQVGWSVFRAMRFIRRNILALAGLFIVGVGLGIYLDLKSKTYDNQVMVIPNFNSADYLYAQIDLLESKIKQGDTVFLKKAGFEHPKKLVSIKIEPVTDIFPMIQREESNIELFKLLAENGDIKKTIEDPTTSRNYRYHNITVVSRSKSSDENLLQPLLKFLNGNQYFTIIRDQYQKNIRTRIIENERTIAQINGVLNMFATYDNSVGKGSNMVYYNNQLNDVIKSKDELVEQTGNLRIELESSNAVIKKSSRVLNLENRDSVSGKIKLILPLVLILLFILVKLTVRFYKKYSEQSTHR